MGLLRVTVGFTVLLGAASFAGKGFGKTGTSSSSPPSNPFAKFEGREAWKAFIEYNAGEWTGRARVFDGDGMQLNRKQELEYSLEIRELPREGSFQTKITSQGLETGSETGATVQCQADYRLDVDLDGSYSSDDAATGFEALLGLEAAQTCIEHSLALSDEERVRCFVNLGFDGNVKGILLLEEQRRSPSAETETGPKGSAAKSGGQDVLKIDRLEVSLEDLTSDEWEGDMTIRSRRERPVDFGQWSTGIAKLGLRWDWTSSSSDTARVTKLRSGFGDDDAETIETKGNLQNHPLFGLNPRCVDYEGGDRFLLLPKGCWLMLPIHVFPGSPYKTEFASILRAEPEEGESAKIHMTRAQRIYDGGGRLSSASTSFLTQGGRLDYHVT